ncbi:hypothetical protein CC85DRAFT_283150 [Cutaneotrichosporon oleaginosum]|uniref:Kinetochore protein Nuf2 N-terminal domain-containing protein n=1 Tax=Cutaneotrichosporon oleaginosum TaxID=879819 RepID=A0A0J0XUX3_9TREE|nr:uncharacterized protein CC85DRAFT_283150 [Cutaneotrichosporon oleaginosum]KLT44847.1 hypothetical protein CC85DRAFT_283150 [Cutaneotrichosporon oleaginosum]TXT11983.1 hypothetical protein COLE_02393 [Cutaneotrichosporon oleaginosum]
MSRKADAKALAGFPLMAASEIRDCMEALGITVHPDDLTKPTAATTHAIWAALLDELMDISPEMLEQPKLAATEGMANPELYMDTLGAIMFYNHCKRLADLCRVQDFNLADLIRPDQLRLRVVLSGIMNFAKFREERRGFQQALAERLHGEQTRADELRRKLDHINAEIAEIKAKREEDVPRIEAARARNENLRQQLLQLGTTQRAVSAEVERLKQERFALSQEHRSRTEELHGLEQAVADAQTKLMRSPDRVRRGIADKERQLAEQRALKNELDGHLRADELRLRVFTEIAEGVAALNRVQKEIIAFRDQADEKRRANSERRDEIRGLENQLHGLEREAAHLESKLQDMKGRFDKLAEDRVRERERFEARERELSAQRAALQAERMAEGEEVARLEREAHEYDLKTAEFARERERHHTELVKEWKLLEAHMTDYMAAMTQKLGLELDVEL